jgi:hypothetical protein
MRGLRWSCTVNTRLFSAIVLAGAALTGPAVVTTVTVGAAAGLAGCGSKDVKTLPLELPDMGLLGVAVDLAPADLPPLSDMGLVGLEGGVALPDR